MKQYNLSKLAKRRWYVIACVLVACFQFVVLLATAATRTLANDFFCDYNAPSVHAQPAILSSHDPVLVSRGSKLFNLIVLKFVIDNFGASVILPAVAIGYIGFCLDRSFRRLEE